MIKRIIKLDGRVEPFEPSKVNGWGEWASKKCVGKDGEPLVDWSYVVTKAVSILPEEVTSQQLQEALIKVCLDESTWSYYKMAGRLFAAFLKKKIYKGKDHPTIFELHRNLQLIGLMRDLDYTREEYDYLETIINHERDFDSPHFQLKQIREKYSIKNRLTGDEYETQQFACMRMAMALAEDQPADRRMEDVVNFYNLFSLNMINCPTPNWVNLGTKHRGLASCCLYTTYDDVVSLAIGDHIAYTMTYMSAGIGSHINTRSIGDPVRQGAFKHQGRLPYYRALVFAVKANLQNGRGGAVTTHYSAFDPEVETICRLKNPRSTEDKRIIGMDYSMSGNKFLARKVAKKEQIFLFNSYNAPDLYDAFYSSDLEKFAEIYAKYEADPNFKKRYVNARDILIPVLNEGYETGRAYLNWIDEINHHTPFLDTIHSSNLCQEITLPTKGYLDMMDLYSFEDHGRGEVAICSLAGILVANIPDEATYEKAMYYSLLMVDKCIHQAHYALPHVGVTCKARMSAGIGIVGLAHLMAKENLKYSSREGKNFIHQLAEKHMYYAIKASLRLGKELGNAPWIHKTKWPQGWLPLDTYCKRVDEVHSAELQYDWESLRSEIIANGGIRNSALIAHMPAESSSKASATTNSVYPVRELAMNKTDNEIVLQWAAPEGDTLGDNYEIAWNIDSMDMIDVYAIIQKWTDQAISADLWRKIIGSEKVSSTEMLNIYLYMTKMGMKTRYYQNSLTTKGGYVINGEEAAPEEVVTEVVQGDNCAGGACSI